MIVFTEQELEILGRVTLVQLAIDIEAGILHEGTLSGDLTVLDYLKNYFIPEQLVEVSEPTQSNKVYKVDLYYDKECTRYATTEIVEAASVEDVAVSRPWLTMKIEEDIAIQIPVLFSATITHDWEDGYGCDHKDYIKTLYVQARSYKEGTQKLTAKYLECRGQSKDYVLGRVYKESKNSLDILLGK